MTKYFFHFRFIFRFCFTWNVRCHWIWLKELHQQPWSERFFSSSLYFAAHMWLRIIKKTFQFWPGIFDVRRGPEGAGKCRSNLRSGVPLFLRREGTQKKKKKKNRDAWSQVSAREVNQPAWQAVEREGGKSKWARPIFSRFTRSSFPFPFPSDACHGRGPEGGVGFGRLC